MKSYMGLKPFCISLVCVFIVLDDKFTHMEQTTTLINSETYCSVMHSKSSQFTGPVKMLDAFNAEYIEENSITNTLSQAGFES